MNAISRIVSFVFIAFWMTFVFLDYWQKHPVYYQSFHHFQYWGLSITLALFGAGVVWFMLKFGKSKKTHPLIKGLSVAALFLFVGVLSAGIAYGQLFGQDNFNAHKAFRILLMTGGTALAVYVLVLAVYVFGAMVIKVMRLELKLEDTFVINMAVGIMCLVLCLFLLGVVSGLYSFVVLPLMAIVLYFGRQHAYYFVKATLWQPLSLAKEMNWIGATCFYLLIVLYSVNFMAANTPMPPGFDALTHYANLPSLIGGRHSLVEGFQPYNWSLLMSLGYILFGSTSISLVLSYLGGVLSAFAMFALCRNWLGMSINATLAAILVFSLTPSFVIQSTGEFKVDLGLLFILLGVVLILLNYLNPMPKETPKAKIEMASALEGPQLVAMGLLTGFALGIKLTALYFALSLVCALWYARCGKRGFFAAFLVGLFLVFFLKMDAVSGLREYHLGVETLQWGVLASGLLLMVGVFLNDKEAYVATFRSSVVYGVFLVLPFLPWVVKNGVETKSLSAEKLLNGKQPSPAINLQIIEQNLHSSEK